jgi:hypothetical protein
MAEHIDKTFDELFYSIPTLKWLPWVGKNYNFTGNNKLLIVGESHYDWEEEGSVDDLQYPEFTRWFISGHTVEDPNIPTRVLRNTERVLYYDNPADTQKINLWHSSCYYNIVQRYMQNKNERPNVEDYLTAWDTFFKVIEVLKPQYCLFCGVEASNYSYNLERGLEGNNFRSEGIQYLEKIGSVYSRTALVSNSMGYSCKLIFMKHPSRYFPWESWAEFVHQQMPDYVSWLSNNKV